MKTLLSLLLMLLSSIASPVEPKGQSIEFSSPQLTPDRVLELTARYLIKEKQINLEDYVLEQVTYRFYASSNRPKSVERYGWDLYFGCKPPKNVPGCDFAVSVSNLKDPKFIFHSGH